MKFAPTKQPLRDEMRSKLAALSSANVRASSAAVWERLWAISELVAAEWVMAYVSHAHEVETHGLIRQLGAMGKRVCVPVFDDGTQQYAISEVRDFSAELAPGRFGILEPRPDFIRPVSFDRAQAWLVPGLAFDERGNRLGRGAGHFDRLLRAARGTKIALAYDFQVVNEVPTAAHDVAVDFLVTETRVVHCQRK